MCVCVCLCTLYWVSSFVSTEKIMPIRITSITRKMGRKPETSKNDCESLKSLRPSSFFLLLLLLRCLFSLIILWWWGPKTRERFNNIIYGSTGSTLNVSETQIQWRQLWRNQRKENTSEIQRISIDKTMCWWYRCAQTGTREKQCSSTCVEAGGADGIWLSKCFVELLCFCRPANEATGRHTTKNVSSHRYIEIGCEQAIKLCECGLVKGEDAKNGYL